MNIENYFHDYKNKINSIIDSSLAEKNLANNVALCFNLAADYEIWLDSIGDRLESIIYKNAIKVYQDALGCMLEGHYQSAFMGLRYCFERTLCGVYLSANELELRTWLNGGRDTYWSEILGKESKHPDVDENGCDSNLDKGLFSIKFVNAFFPELQDEIRHFKRMAMSVYRECSEFVHGNPTVLVKIPKHLEFKSELMFLWCEKALIMKRVMFFSFALRYLAYIKDDEKAKIADIIKDDFSTVKPINDMF